MKKEKRVLQAGDLVKAVGYDSDGDCLDGSGLFCVNYIYGDNIVELYNPVYDTQFKIHRRQVTHVKFKKKKQPRVISDERFFVNNYQSSGMRNSSINHTIGDAINVSTGYKLKEILELGIVARHTVEEKK